MVLTFMKSPLQAKDITPRGADRQLLRYQQAQDTPDVPSKTGSRPMRPVVKTISGNGNQQGLSLSTTSMPDFVMEKGQQYCIRTSCIHYWNVC